MPSTTDHVVLPAALIERMGKYQEQRSPREIQVQYGLALVRGRRYAHAARALLQALEEPGSVPSSADIQLLLAHTLEIDGTPELAFRAYLEAVHQEMSLAPELMPYLHAKLTPEIASALAGWVDGQFKETELSVTEPIDRLHIDLFRCRVQVYVHNLPKARDALLRAKGADTQLFKAVAPPLLSLETMPSAGASFDDGNWLLALAEIRHILGQNDALDLVEKALAAGLNDGTDYPDAPAYEFKAQVLETRGDTTEAAVAHYEAGCRYRWRGDNARALAQFEKSRALDPVRCATYWQLVDVHRFLSYTEGYPYVIEEHARAALAAWEAGIERGEPVSEDSWAFEARALLNEQFARLPNANVSELNWEAIAFLERAILCNSENGYRWAYLARFHRALVNPASALAASECAIEMAPDNVVALEERAAVLSVVGDAAAALEVIDKRRAIESGPNAWLDALRAWNLLLTGPHDEALVLLNTALKTSPNDLWFLSMREVSHRALQHWSQAADDARAILSQYLPENTYDLSRFAWARYGLREIAPARELFEEMTNDETEEGNAHRGLGLCALAEGNEDAARRHLALGTELAKTIRELDDLLLADFPFAYHLAEARSNTEVANRVLEELKPLIEKRREQLSAARMLEAEIREAIGADDGRTRAANWKWVGATATLARVYAEKSDWQASAAAYQLLEASGRFAQATIGLCRALDALIQDARRHLAEGDTEGAERELAKIRPFVTTSAQAMRSGDLHAVTAMVRFAKGDTNDAGTAFIEALRSYRVGPSCSGKLLAAAARMSITSTNQFWAIRDCWDALAVSADVDKTDRMDLTAATDALSCYLTEAFSLRETAQIEDRLPIVVPLILEVSDELVPMVDPEQDGGDFLKRRIEDMRIRLKDALGLVVPGVRVRSVSSLSPNSFNVQVDEAKVLEGAAYRSMAFCFGPIAAIVGAGIEESSLVPAWIGATGEIGAWVAGERREAIALSGLEYQTAPEFLIAQVEFVIRCNAAKLLNSDDMDRLVQGWQAEDADTVALISPLLKDLRARLAFLQILRELLREKVSIAPWKEIVQTVHEVGLDATDRAVNAIRKRLNDRLVVNAVRPWLVPEEWESWIQSKDGEMRFFGSPINIQDALTTVRAMMQKSPPATVIVTRSLELRPYVERLLENEFPMLPVLALIELAKSDAPSGGISAALRNEARANV